MTRFHLDGRFRRACGLALLAPAFAAMAQPAADTLRLPGLPEAEHLAQMALELTMGDGPPGHGDAQRVVKGAPYCADAVHENIQWLPDGQGGMGNRISHKTMTRLCRDGEGRTRQEVDSAGHKRIYLADPVAHENWVLDPEHKTARQLGGSGGFGWSGSWSGGVDSSAWRDYAQRMRDWAREMAEAFRGWEGREDRDRSDRADRADRADRRPRSATPPVPPAAPMAPAVPPVPAAPAAPLPPPSPAVVDVMPGGRGGDVRVYRFDGSASVAPPEVRFRAQQLAPRGEGVLSALGSRDIEGLRVNGERTTWTIEAGKLGNEKPIVITREVWTSPDLLVQVHTRDFDPRSGEVSYRLQNIKRGEPDAALMKLPADYKASRRSERRDRGERREAPARSEKS